MNDEIKTDELTLGQITADPEVQPRVKLNDRAVTRYQTDMQHGVVFMAIVVFFDGAKYWLADGFHRLAAAKLAGLKTIRAEIRDGSRDDALEFANNANATHGLPLTNADKRRIVDRMMRSRKWNEKSDKAIAKVAGVSDRFVASRKKKLPANGSQTRRRVTRMGTTFEMEVSKIGQAQKNRATAKEAAADAAAAPQEQAKQTPTQGDQSAPADEGFSSTTPIGAQPKQSEGSQLAAASRPVEDVDAPDPGGEAVQPSDPQDSGAPAQPALGILLLAPPVTDSALLSTAKAEFLDEDGSPIVGRLLILLDDDGQSDGFGVLNTATGTLAKIGFPHAFRLQDIHGERRGMWAAIATTDTDETNPRDVLQRLLTATRGSVKEIQVGGK